MENSSGTITAARRASLNVANSLIMTAIGAVDAGDIPFADTVVVTVLRVLDAYEAVTQLAPGRPDPDVANALKPLYRVGRPDA